MSSIPSLNILRRANKADSGEKSIVYVQREKTLAELRVILVADEIMLDTDKFVNEGAAIGKGSESNLKIGDLAKSNSITIQAKDYATATVEKVAIPTNDIKAPEGMKSTNVEAKVGGQEDLQSARSTVVASGSAKIDMKTLRGIFELQDEERQLIYKNAGLGFGIDISSNGGPQRTGHQAAEVVPFSDIKFTECERGTEDIYIAYTARASAYASNGWCEAAIAVESPWASGSVGMSTQSEKSSTSSSSTIYVTGRYLYSQCQVTLPYKVNASPQFKQEMKYALAATDPKLRAELVKRVISEFGHVYVSSVELGGMKHLTTSKTVSAQTTADSVKTDMKAAIAAKYSVYGGSVKAAGGGSTGTSQSSTNSFENMQFDTVGGNVYTSDITEWKESLVEFDHWKITRVVRVKSVIELFDDKTQAEILACVPQLPAAPVQPARPAYTPFYRLWSPSLQAHFYTIDPKEREQYIREKGYQDSMVIGNAIPAQAPNTVPLYRMVENGRRCFLTIHENVYKQILNNRAWRGDGIIAWVYPTYRTDAKPLFCIVKVMQNGEWERICTTDSADREWHMKSSGYRYDDDYGRIPAYLPAW